MRFYQGLTIVALVLLAACDTPTPEPEITVTASDFTATIDENPTSGDALGTLTATTNMGAVTFTLVSQDPEGAIALASDGTLTVDDASLFDFETRTTLSASVSAANGDISETLQVTITLRDVADASITANDFSVSMQENPASGTMLGSLTATTDQGTLVFALVSEDPTGAFTVESDGRLFVNDAALYDYETRTMLTATVSATAAGVSQEARVTVTLSDVAEAALSAFVEETAAHVFSTIDVGQDAYPSLADYDGDGDLDLIAGSLDGKFYLFKNEGGEFQEQTSNNNAFINFDVGADSRHTFADVDEDGDLDLVSGESNGPIFYYRNDAGVFVEQTGTDNPFGNIRHTIDSKPAFSDWDGDGDLDLLIGYFNQIHAYRNDGGTYVGMGGASPFAAVDFQTHYFPTFVDLDGDNKEELVIGRLGGDLRLYRMDGEGNYQYAEDETATVFNTIDVGTYSSPAFIDLNDDGKLDMISGNGQGTIKLFLASE